ncbi:hypothetical protein PV328_006071 [Microctonus aethiopoides]|uniref:Uncharacterized protein n=1 Tax=Microctonus aethiopoides TaxID=144406 RepID=A0AA39KT60_9HYME|nr:hypothetical protein PV328_006071 [Microctonus aethiopoides]
MADFGANFQCSKDNDNDCESFFRDKTERRYNVNLTEVQYKFNYLQYTKIQWVKYIAEKKITQCHSIDAKHASMPHPTVLLNQVPSNVQEGTLRVNVPRQGTHQQSASNSKVTTEPMLLYALYTLKNHRISTNKMHTKTTDKHTDET